MSNARARIVDRCLWTAQTLVALLFLFAGSMKFVLPAAQMQGPVALPIAFLRFIGVCECAGALGLLLPGLLRVRTSLTPLAAAGLTVIMVGATVISAVGGVAMAVLPAIVGVVTAAIAYGRARVLPLTSVSRRALRAA